MRSWLILELTAARRGVVTFGSASGSADSQFAHDLRESWTQRLSLRFSRRIRTVDSSLAMLHAREHRFHREVIYWGMGSNL